MAPRKPQSQIAPNVTTRSMQVLSLRKLADRILKLPRELRDMVYGYCAGWNDAVDWHDEEQHCRLFELYQQFDEARIEGLVEHVLPTTTPNILLMRWQITVEALQVLREISLVIKYPFHSPNLHTYGDPVIWGISNATLQSVRRIVLDLSLTGVFLMYQWRNILWDLFRLWETKNCLESLQLKLHNDRPVLNVLVSKKLECYSKSAPDGERGLMFA